MQMSRRTMIAGSAAVLSAPVLAALSAGALRRAPRLAVRNAAAVSQAQLFANLTFVDFAAIPVALSLTDTSGGQQGAAGLAPGGLDTICAGLTAQAAADGHPWGDLIVTGGGRNLRALSPANGIAANPSLLAGDTQASFGPVSGQVSNGLLTFPGVGSFARPSAADIFSCASGPFNPAGMNPEMLAILPRLAAALNRSTLLTGPSQPDGEDPASYYTAPVTNHYARIVHAASRGGRGYAFPYDDVAPSGGADQSGSVSSGSPAQLAITDGAVHT